MTLNSQNFPKEVILSGADCFFLAMERHYEKYGNEGNVCHLRVSINAIITKELISKQLAKFKIFDWLSKIELEKGRLFQKPKWVYNENKTCSLEISEFNTRFDEAMPEEVINRGIFIRDACLYHFTILHKDNDTTDIIFSWHHILMDAQGAETLIKLLGEEIEEEKIKFFPDEEKKINPFKAFYILHFSKEFIKKTSKAPLVQLVEKRPSNKVNSAYHVIEFTEEQTKLIDKRALEHGAKISKGSFYLACTTKSINEWLVTKNNTKGAFWIPIPQNRRPRGRYGPVISNLQAFMFYRIPREKTAVLKTCTEFITAQMIDLIRHKRPDDYSIMSNLLRRIPSRFYYWLIKGPAGGSMASFLYSDPGINVFNSFLGHSVINITNYPPATYPPGLITIFERFNNKQKIVLNYTLEVVSKEDLSILEQNILRELLGDTCIQN